MTDIISNKHENTSNKNQELIQKENNPSGGTPLTPDQIAVKSTKEILENPFDTFDCLDYLNEFYPQLDLENFEKISEAIVNIESIEQTSLIDINKLSEFITDEKLTINLENYAIYDFIFRKAIPQILKFKPDDHLSVLDVGGGPTVYQHFPLIGISDSIVHCEYLSDNRDEITKFITGESKFDWHTYSLMAQKF